MATKANKVRFEREILEVPVLNSATALKKAKATDLVEVLDVYKNLKGIEVRWVRGRPVCNFLEVDGDGEDSILVLQVSPFDQRLQTGWRSRQPNSKGKYTYCPADELVTYDCHTYDVGLDENGQLCRIEDPSQVKKSAPKKRTSHAGLPSA